MTSNDYPASPRSLLGVISDRQLVDRAAQSDGPDDETISKARGEDPSAIDGPPISRPRETKSRGED